LDGVEAEDILERARLLGEAPLADQAAGYELALSELEELLAKASPR
jgi:hypothetical protein